PRRQRLAGLDGLRGLAALFVVVNHVFLRAFPGYPVDKAPFWAGPVIYRRFAVVVFPLLLLVVRRWGAIAMVATVTFVVATVGIVGPHISHLHIFVIQSPPDLAALFAAGVLTAGIVGASEARKSWPWGWLALAAAAPVLVTIW